VVETKTIFVIFEKAESLDSRKTRSRGEIASRLRQKYLFLIENQKNPAADED
jgi:hypothetical protein